MMDRSDDEGKRLEGCEMRGEPQSEWEKSQAWVAEPIGSIECVVGARNVDDSFLEIKKRKA